MTIWTKLSDRQPTEEDFQAGAVYGGAGAYGWLQSIVCHKPPDSPFYTHWQRVTPPERPRLRRWWLNTYGGVLGAGMYETKEQADANAMMENRLECIPVIEWHHKEDPVEPMEGA